MPSPKAEDSVLEVVGASVPAKPKSGLAGMIAQAGAAEPEAGGDMAAIPDETIAGLRALAIEMIAAQRVVEQREADLTAARATLADIEEHRLPDLMEANDLPRFDFIDKTTGQRVLIKFESKWRVTMPGKTEPMNEPIRRDIFAWLREKGKGGVIKKVVEVSAGTRSDEHMIALMDHIKNFDNALDPAILENVHASTLTSVISKMKDDGENVHEGIRVDPVRRAKVSGR